MDQELHNLTVFHKVSIIALSRARFSPEVFSREGFTSKLMLLADIQFLQDLDWRVSFFWLSSAGGVLSVSCHVDLPNMAVCFLKDNKGQSKGNCYGLK